MTRAEQILALVTEHGPLTSAEIGRHLGLAQSYARLLVSQLQSLYIVEYRRDYSGGRYYPRALYGRREHFNQRDAKPPPRQTSVESNRRYRQRQKGAVASVFHLGTPHAQRRPVPHIY